MAAEGASCKLHGDDKVHWWGRTARVSGGEGHCPMREESWERRWGIPGSSAPFFFHYSTLSEKELMIALHISSTLSGQVWVQKTVAS